MKERPVYLRTKWIVGHLLILALVTLMMNLGFWQLRRLHHREHLNALTHAAMNATPIEASSIGIEGLAPYTHVEIVGKWHPLATELIRYPLHDGQPGYEVITPIWTADNHKYLVDRGWIPLDKGKTMSLDPTSMSDSARIAGLVRIGITTSAKPGFNDGKPPVPTLGAIGSERWIQLLTPAGPEDPIPLDLPDLSNGPHLSYALQWFSFCMIAVGGWFTVLWKASHEKTLAEIETENREGVGEPPQ